MPLYRDPETEQSIATHSMIKTFRRCPRQAYYKYKLRLKPRTLSKPLQRGTWVHRLLEVYCDELKEHSPRAQRSEPVRAAALEGMWAEHQRLSATFTELFDEEKEQLGDLPREIARVMRSYFWHYANETWIVHEVEFILETEFPDGSIYRGKVDLLIENQYGLWIVDHKTHARLPNIDFRLLDAQSALYIWAAVRNQIPVTGHIWNYLRWKPATIPQVLKDGSRFSARTIETDYPTFAWALKNSGLEVARYAQQLRMLKGLRYRAGEPQMSPFFRRDILEKSPELLKRVASEGYHTARRMNEYPFDRVDFIERVVDRSCTFACSYTNLCTTELFGGNVNAAMKGFTVGDPLEYYQDQDSKIDRTRED